MKKFTIKSFNVKYPDDNACLAEIFNNRYGSLTKCPTCKRDDTWFYKVTNRKCYACQYCSYQLHPLAGTIFHKSDTSLKSWFYAIFLFANSRNGVSAKELERALGVTYKTAWRMAKQIRLLFAQANESLSDVVEVDETYIGGFGHGKQGRSLDKKTPVIGLIQRKGDAIAKVVRNVKFSSVIPLIRKNVKPGSTVMTDEFRIYNPIEKMGYEHHKIKHSEGQYVKGKVYTNTVEGFWSQLKRSLSGTYHAVSPKYLQHYVDEFSYRYSKRNLPTSLFYPMISRAARPA